MSNPKEQRSRRGQTQRLNEDEGRATGGGRRATERLSPDGDEWSRAEPVNPDWRSGRVGTRRATRRGALPSSPQEFQLWLQAGGWRYVAGIALLAVVLLIALLAFARGDDGDIAAGADQLAPTTASEPALGGAGLTTDALPTVTLLPPTPAPPQRFIVTGTSGEGLNLRADHDVNSAIIQFYPEGTTLEQVAEDFTGADRLWRKVRAPDGNEGWVAADFLVPTP